MTLAPLVRPRGLASWGCYRGGLHLDAPRLGEQSAPFNSEDCTVIDSGGFHLVARWGEAPGWPVSRQVHLNFGLDAPYGVYADLSLETSHGRATQRLRWIEPGTFRMGSPEDEAERKDREGPRHRVTLTRGFWLADTACTQALWLTVMGDNPSRFQGDPERPVEQVSWQRVQDFLRALEVLLPGVRADLPTEAEWEYACRAGTETPFSFGATITPEQVNYDGQYPYAGGAKGLYRGTTVPVKSLPASPWGLYEMHGNVWEWCADGQRDYTAEPAEDPVGPLSGYLTLRVVRGGSRFIDAGFARSAYRFRIVPGDVSSDRGFRLCLRSIEPGPEPARAAGAAPKGRGGEAGGPPGGGWFDRLLHPFGKNKR
ncbi:MAG: formylglycine-generating enzyme family protein [Gammaproteobacteria bacterium]|nr:formylglycine-generating enzyme family protein [Gammaproteobacteria bacterium]